MKHPVKKKLDHCFAKIHVSRKLKRLLKNELASVQSAIDDVIASRKALLNGSGYEASVISDMRQMLKHTATLNHYQTYLVTLFDTLQVPKPRYLIEKVQSAMHLLRIVDVGLGHGERLSNPARRSLEQDKYVRDLTRLKIKFGDWGLRDSKN